MSYCPNCGGEVSASDRFCRSCGTAIGEQAAPQAAAPPPVDAAQHAPPAQSLAYAPPPAAPPEEPARRGVPLPATRRARAMFIAAVIVLAAALVAVPFALLDEDDGTEQAASSEPADTSETETEASGAQDSDSDGIPDTEDEEPYTAPGDVEPEAEEPAEPEPQQKHKTVGQSANDGGVKYTLNSLEEVTSLPVTEYSDPISARSGAKLVAARISIKNNGQAPIDPLCGGAEGFVLLDERDRNYKAEDNVLDIQGNDSVCGDGIAPGFRDDFTIVYEIPDDARIGGLVVWNAEDEDDYDGEIDQIVFTP